MWKPTASVSPKEVIGRRAFGDRDKVFTSDGKIRIDVFLDTRYQNDLSFDRLGIKKPTDEVVRFLTPKCNKHASIVMKPFFGWAAIKVSELKRLEVKPTPDDANDNPYHADLLRNDYRSRELAETLAFRLAYQVHDLIDPAKEAGDGWLKRFLSWFS